MSVKRYYSFKIVTYNTDIECFKPLLEESFKYAWILHDKDKTDAHVHILATFKANKSFECVRKMVVGDQNTFAQEMTNRFDDFTYLTHEEGYDKAIYLPEDIHTNDLKYFTGKGIDKQVDNATFINDLISRARGVISMYDMAVKYGRDYILHRFDYEAFGRDIIVEDIENTRKELEKMPDDTPIPKEFEQMEIKE